MSHQSAYDVYALYAGSAVMGVTGWVMTPRLVMAHVPFGVALPIAGIAAVALLIALALPAGLVVSGAYAFDKAPTVLGGLGLAVETGVDMTPTGVFAVLVSMSWLTVRKLGTMWVRSDG